MEHKIIYEEKNNTIEVERHYVGAKTIAELLFDLTNTSAELNRSSICKSLTKKLPN